jgi:hypothetical protein
LNIYKFLSAYIYVYNPTLFHFETTSLKASDHMHSSNDSLDLKSASACQITFFSISRERRNERKQIAGEQNSAITTKQFALEPATFPHPLTPPGKAFLFHRTVLRTMPSQLHAGQLRFHVSFVFVEARLTSVGHPVG